MYYVLQNGDMNCLFKTFCKFLDSEPPIATCKLHNSLTKFQILPTAQYTPMLMMWTPTHDLPSTIFSSLPYYVCFFVHFKDSGAQFYPGHAAAAQHILLFYTAEESLINEKGPHRFYDLIKYIPYIQQEIFVFTHVVFVYFGLYQNGSKMYTKYVKMLIFY